MRLAMIAKWLINVNNVGCGMVDCLVYHTRFKLCGNVDIQASKSELCDDMVLGLQPWGSVGLMFCQTRRSDSSYPLVI